MSGSGDGRRPDRDDRRRERIDEEGSVVSGPRGRQLTNSQKLGIAALLVVVFVGVIWVQQLTRKPPQSKSAEMAMSNGIGNFRPAPIVTPPPAPTPPPLPMPAPQPVRPVFGQTRHEMTPAESPIFAFSGGEVVPETTGRQQQPNGRTVAAVAPAETPLSARLRPTVLSGAKASILPHPDMLMTEGTIIPCILQTAINTELAGYVKCVIPQDVRSTTGNVVLLDRGTTVVGEIDGGLLAGQDRVFVLWDRAETPDHAIIELDSPGTDELGRAGVTGGINNHLVEKFGAAALLTVVQGALQAGTALAGNSGTNNNGFSFNSFQSNGENIANTALQATINIPPTLEKNQGDTVSIFVAKDLDFSDVYKLRVTSAGYPQ